MESVTELTIAEERELNLAKIKGVIAQMLQVPDDSHWGIEDHDENGLYLAHYSKGASLHHYGDIRGVVVDPKARIIVANAPPTPILACVNKLQVEEDGNFIIRDDLGIDHKFAPDQVIGQARAFEGVIIRAFKYNKRVYFAGHKKLNCEKSHWAQSPGFLDCYKGANGPKPEELFSPDCDYSPFYYTFLVVHPELIACTKQDVIYPYIVYLGCNNEWTECPSYTNVEKEPFYKPKKLTDVGAKVKWPCMHQPPQRTLLECNQFITQGYYPAVLHKDSRLDYGESCIIHYKQGNKVRALTIVGPSFYWRYRMRDGAWRNYTRFLSLITDAMDKCRDEEWVQKYKSKYIFFRKMSPQQIEKEILRHPIYLDFIKETDDKPYTPKGVDERIVLIWMNYLYHLPTGQREDARTFIQRYNEDKAKLHEWIMHILHTPPVEPPSRRLEAILKYIRDTKPEVTSRRGGRRGGRVARENKHHTVASKLKFILDHEDGSSFNRLVHEMQTDYVKKQEIAERKAKSEDIESLTEKVGKLELNE
jgi:hypothetical protein